MNIFVIDNFGQIQSVFSESKVENTAYEDEIQSLYAIEKHKPDLIFLNYAVRGEATPDYIDLLLTYNPESKVILIGDNLEEDVIIASLLMGAKGYQDIKELSYFLDRMVDVVMQGEAWITRGLTAKLLAAIQELNLHFVYEDGYLQIEKQLAFA